MAVVDIFRDRERGVRRYNDLRRAMYMPPIKTWEDLTADKQVIKNLQEVYGNDVEALDLMIGIHAEKKPPFFAISDTAFHIFVTMSSRRIATDVFFTKHYHAGLYTQWGLDHIDGTLGLLDLVRRHKPELLDAVNYKDEYNSGTWWRGFFPVSIFTPTISQHDLGTP